MSDHALRARGFLGTEFNAFLFEAIGTDQLGRPLSVVSALARLDMDAWAEAASLARLPREIATSKLSALIAKFPELPQAAKDSRKIAERLVALLPDRVALAGQFVAPPPALGWVEKLMRSTVVFILIMVVLIGMQLLAPYTHAPATSVPAASAVQQ